MKQASIERAMIKRGFELPIYNIELERNANSFSYTVSKGSYVLEWLCWMNDRISCLRVRHKDANWGYSCNTIKKALDLIERLEK